MTFAPKIRTKAPMMLAKFAVRIPKSLSLWSSSFFHTERKVFRFCRALATPTNFDGFKAIVAMNFRWSGGALQVAYSRTPFRYIENM